MKVAYISHSLVAQRQAWFAEALDREIRDRGDAGDDAGVREVYPGSWGNESRDGGYAVQNAGDIYRYKYPRGFWRSHLPAYDPDVILLQQEPVSVTAAQTIAYGETYDVPVVVFTWENLNAPKGDAKDVLQDAAHVVYGNRDARRLAHGVGVSTPSTILPQVGIRSDVFHPPSVQKQYDLVFAGREGDPMKGEALLDEAAARGEWKVKKFHEGPYWPYEDLPKEYGRAWVQVVPSQDVDDRPREQFAPAVTIEGLMCGVPAVLSDQAAIWEWTHERVGPCPAADWFPEGDADELYRRLDHVMDLYHADDGYYAQVAAAGRSWAVENFSNTVVASQYADLLTEVAS